jgi:hypothetical protein
MSTSNADADLLARMDAAKISRFHWKIMFISGMGFFTDAYDLFIIGVVMEMVADLFPSHPRYRYRWRLPGELYYHGGIRCERHTRDDGDLSL